MSPDEPTQLETGSPGGSTPWMSVTSGVAAVAHITGTQIQVGRIASQYPVGGFTMV